MLLLICLPSFFLFGILQFTSAVNNYLGKKKSFDEYKNNYDSQAFCNDILMVFFQDDDSEFSNGTLTMVKLLFYILQVMIQTPMIIDGLRRVSNSIGSQRKFYYFYLFYFLHKTYTHSSL